MSYSDDPLLTRTAELVFEHNRNLHSSLAVSAAEQLDGGSAWWFERRLAIVTLPDERRVLIDGPIALETGLGGFVVDNKQLAREFLARAGAPTIRGEVVADADSAVELAAQWGGSVVLKPLKGSEGKGVTVDVSGSADVRRAFERAKAHGTGVVLEEYIDIDEEFRCMATSSRCLSVIRRVLPSVVGDGVASIGDLIDQKNAQRGENPALFRIPIPRDEIVDSVLAAQGLTQESVLEAGRSVLVRNIGGLTGGGEPYECTETVDAAVRDAAVAAVASIPSLGWAGVDVVLEKGTGRALVLEINVNAGYGGVTFPVHGTSRNVAAEIWPQWRELGSRDDDSIPAFPQWHRVPLKLSSIIIPTDGIEFPMRAGSAFRIYAATRNDLEVSTNAGLIRVDREGAETVWTTSGLAGRHDLLAPRRTARGHGKVRRLLAARDVPRPRGMRARSWSDVIKFFGEEPKQLIAVPVREDWSTETKRVLRGDGDGLTWESGWFVQSRVRGVRMRLYCMRDAVVFATSRPEEDVVSLEYAVFESIGLAGLSAVRAIPGLRWAAVDVVVRPRGVKGSRVLVEGLTVNPRLTADEVLIAGDIEQFFDQVVELGGRKSSAFAASMRSPFRLQ